MKYRTINIAVLIIFLLITAMAAADNTIYTWTDKDGVQRMSNIEPVDPDAKIEVMELKPTANATEPQSHKKEPEKPVIKSAANQLETKVTINGNHVIVPALIIYKAKRVQARLLLDTGASNITLYKKFAQKLDIKEKRKGSIRVAGGELIAAEAVVLNRIEVGPKRRNKLLAGIIENNGPDINHDGLLGMNFLKSFKYTIDFDNQVIRWEK